MAIFKISIHTGPLTASQFEEWAEVAYRRGRIRLSHGTERAYFQVSADDAIGASIKATDALRAAFPHSSYMPVVGNAL